MSYRRTSKNNTLNELFTRYSDFMNISPQLLNAKTKDEFEVWFEKLEQIDKRTLYLFICKNKDKIDSEYLEMTRDRFIKFF